MISCLKICIEFLLAIHIPHLYSNPRFSIFHSPSKADSESLSHFLWRSEKRMASNFLLPKAVTMFDSAVTIHDCCLVLRLSFSGKKLFLACPESTRVFLIRKTRRKKHYLLGWATSHPHPIHPVSPSIVYGASTKLLVRKVLLGKWLYYR